MIFSKRRTGNEKDEKLRVKEKKTEMVARGRIMHTSNACTRERAGAHVSRSLICPLLFYMRRSALQSTVLDSRVCLCYFPRSLGSKIFFFLYLSTISSSFEKKIKKNYMGRKLNNFDEERVIITDLKRIIKRQCESVNIVFMNFNNFEIYR